MANIPAIPPTPSGLAPALQQQLSAIAQAVNTLLGATGSGLNAATTLSMLVSSGLATVSPAGQIAAKSQATVIDYTAPPAPTGLIVTGAMGNCLISWDLPAYLKHAYTEIWRSQVTFTAGVADASIIGSATKVGTAAGYSSMYSDSVGAAGDFWYWIKFVSQANVAGAFNAVSGVRGTTSSDPSYVINLLTASGLYANTPYYYQPTATTINGVAVPIGTYVQDAYIANGSIANAKIGNLQVDNAKISSLSVDKLIAGSLSVGQYAQSTGYVSGSSGWRINGDGTAEFSGVTVRGNVQANSFSQIRLGTNQHIKHGQTAFNTGTGFFLGDNGTGTPVFSLGSVTSGMLWDGSQLSINGNGTFSGSLSGADITGANGTFSGGLLAASGSFAGSLSGSDITGTSGTFSGMLSAGVISNVALSSTPYTSGTYTITVPAGFTSLRVTMVGGGGGGGPGANIGYGGGGGGGGAGAFVEGVFSGLTPGDTYSLVVGAGGAGSTTLSAWPYYGAPPGTDGGSTSITNNGTSITLVSTPGGFGGTSAWYGGVGGAIGGINGTMYLGGSGGSPDRGWGIGGLGGSRYPTTSGLSGSGYGAGGGGGSAWGAGVGGNGSGGKAVLEFFNPNGVVLRAEYSTLLAALTRQGIAIV